MSEATMKPEEAQAVLFNDVFVPAFVEKLAEFNIQPQSQADLVEMLKIAEALEVADAQGLTKEAAATEQPDALLKTASDSLAAMIHQASAKPSKPTDLIKAAAAVLTKQSSDDTKSSED